MAFLQALLLLFLLCHAVITNDDVVCVVLCMSHDKQAIIIYAYALQSSSLYKTCSYSVARSTSKNRKKVLYSDLNLLKNIVKH